MVLSWNQRVAKVSVNGIEQGMFSTISVFENDAAVHPEELLFMGFDFLSNNALGQGGHC